MCLARAPWDVYCGVRAFELRDLEPSAPVVRYEHEHPGDLLHIDTKKLGRIERMGHRVTGNSRTPWRGLGIPVRRGR